ncbi:MAG TPA: NADH-quinone oxidoreductase subunit J [Myxococcaceae bacterium]|nr:NADH-quinone oxidoreductase subunit J [Myxococcaceae bacterium]
MADTLQKPSRHAEVLVGVVLLVVVVAFVFWIFVKEVLPGLAPVATQGAELARPSDLLFYVIAAVSIVSGAGVAFSRSIIYAALSLLGALLGIGALFIFLSADYVAVSQLLIYIGGVLVLILFAVMLTSKIGDKSHTNPSIGVLPGIGLTVALIAVLGYVATRTPWISNPNAPNPAQTARTIGDVFLKEYLLPFEVSSLVLLATLIGAVVVARKEIKE